MHSPDIFCIYEFGFRRTVCDKKREQSGPEEISSAAKYVATSTGMRSSPKFQTGVENDWVVQPKTVLQTIASTTKI